MYADMQSGRLMKLCIYTIMHIITDKEKDRRAVRAKGTGEG